MIMSKKLTAERIAEIEKTPIIYDDDAPQLTKDELTEFVPYHAAAAHRMQETISIHIDADILAMIKASGTDYQKRINRCLREAVLSGTF